MKRSEGIVTARDGGTRLVVSAAMAVTVLDGFDAFSLSLMAPHFSARLGFASADLGPIFASAMGGMIVGAIAGGTLADRFGRLRVLMLAMALFGLAALLMPVMGTVAQFIANRAIAGIGLGAAAPIAVSLLNRSGAAPPTPFAIALVWAGIPIGGSLAALFSYLFITPDRWWWIFVLGGALPVPVAAFAFAVFRHVAAPTAAATVPRGSIAALFRDGYALRTTALAGVFFFGFVTTSIIVNWLPTILSHRQGSAGLISLTFGAINAGGVLGTVLLGYLGSGRRARDILAVSWAVAGICGISLAIFAFSLSMLAVIAVIGATIATGAQALSIAFANQLHSARGLQTTSLGLMAGLGRVGQFGALSASGSVVALTSREELVFVLAGAGACIAACLSLLVIIDASGRGIENR